jgi:hypothetical protein
VHFCDCYLTFVQPLAVHFAALEMFRSGERAQVSTEQRRLVLPGGECAQVPERSYGNRREPFLSPRAATGLAGRCVRQSKEEGQVCSTIITASNFGECIW